MSSNPSLSYHEPSIVVIVILSGFLLLLNIVNWGLDKLVYCGLIGQVFLGIAWGTPGANWLSSDVENTIMQLGYLGLILLVFEGGLSTSFRSLKANLGLSCGVAATGIAVPMGLSFVLQSMLGVSPLQAFTAGAALCSTSLGTTFTILGTSGLSTTRLGVVLTSAAMMDDVVGLIMVQIISNLGSGAFDAVTVVRPVLVSLAFATLVPAACRFLVKPVTLRLNSLRQKDSMSRLDTILKRQQTAFILHTLLLLGLVIGGTYAGTSSLLAAYLAGASTSWWDSDVPHPEVKNDAPAEAQAGSEDIPETSGIAVYERYYKAAVELILKPFFFASIGFSVPITTMFSGPIVWRGVVYSILMAIGKLFCGIWLISFANPLGFVQKLAVKLSNFTRKQANSVAPGNQCTGATPSNGGNGTPQPVSEADRASQEESAPSSQPRREQIALQPLNQAPTPSPTTRNNSPKPEMPFSLYPSCIVAFGMVARGEIGFLIAALAESKGIFGRETGGQPSRAFLVITWAISLCTMIGPICVGLLVNRVKKLESSRGPGKRDVLGVWGVR